MTSHYDNILPTDFEFQPEPQPGWELVKKLFSRTGYHLCIGEGGDVYSTNSETDKYANLELKPIDTGIVCIRGVKSGLYLGFDEKGRLIGMKSMEEACLFHERMIPSYYNVYQCKKYEKKKWYIAISKRGRVKNGKRSKARKKHSHFLPRKAT